jgi:hypothetical protein
MKKQTAAPKTQTHMAPGKTSILQRQCACGTHTVAGGDCAGCQRNGKAMRFERRTEDDSTSTRINNIDMDQQSSDHDELLSRATKVSQDFSHIPVRLGMLSMPEPAIATRPMIVNSASPAGFLKDSSWISLNGQNPTAMASQLSKPGVTKLTSNSGKSCPTFIEVARVEPIKLTKDDIGKGIYSKGGADVVMKVSNPFGSNFAGTKVHENLKTVKLACGEVNCCGNQLGLGKLGDEGSNWVVDYKNELIDRHMAEIRVSPPQSFLHAKGVDNCDAQCEQFYDCGGKQFGPRFRISYLMSKDVMSGEKALNITKITVQKQALDVVDIKKAEPDKTGVLGPAMEKMKQAR